MDAGGYIRQIFSAAMEYLVDASEYSQREIAAQVGVSPSSLSDYIKGRREGSEDIRRRIASVLGIPYDRMLTLGQLISKGYNPSDWEYLLHGNRYNQVQEDTRLFVRRTSSDDKADILLVPPPDRFAEDVTEISGAFLDDYVPHRDFSYARKYSTLTDGRPFPEGARPTDVIAFQAEWLEAHGGVKGSVAFRAKDDLETPEVCNYDMVLVRLITNGDQFLSGRIYAVQFEEDPNIYFRTLMRVCGELLLTKAGYRVARDQVHIIGQVVWVGHEL